MEFENRTFGRKATSKDAGAASVGSAGGIPMYMASAGDRCRIVAITGNDDTRRFLANLGFAQGSEISVVSRHGRNLIMDVKGSRIAMNSDAVSCLHYIPM